MLTTCLWFDNKAEEAAGFYVNLFTEAGRTAKITRVARYNESGAQASGQPIGSAMTVLFELDGSEFLGLNGGPNFRFSPAVSFIIHCQTQEEIDYFWEKLGKDGEEGQCGWIDRDKYGISWQIVPTILEELVSSSDTEKAERAMMAMLKMKKLEIERLQKAFEGEEG